MFYGPNAFVNAFEKFEGGAAIFAYRVNNPEQYGVVEFDKNGRAISLDLINNK